MTLVDTHCHLDYPDFDGQRQEIVNRARQNGIAMIINPGTNLVSSRKALELSDRFPEIYAGAGIHPNDGNEWKDGIIDELRDIAKDKKVVAIGEIGLDFYRDYTDKKLQRKMFEKQLSLAAELELPVIIHNRNADEEIMDHLISWQRSLADENSPLAEKPGVLHSFSGDEKMAAVALAHNFMIGITGPVTFKNAPDLQLFVKDLPLEKLLIETDSPFLSPHPERGKRNEPAKVRLVADKIAEIKQIEREELYSASTNNAKELFHVELDL